MYNGIIRHAIRDICPRCGKPFEDEGGFRNECNCPSLIEKNPNLTCLFTNDDFDVWEKINTPRFVGYHRQPEPISPCCKSDIIKLQTTVGFHEKDSKWFKIMSPSSVESNYVHRTPYWICIKCGKVYVLRKTK